LRRRIRSVLAPRRIEHQGLGGGAFGLAVRQHGLDQLELADPLAELLALAGVAQGIPD
jgi:hypothetical protein